MNTPQNTAPDFGEPWHKSSFNSPLGASGDFEGVLEIYSRENRLRIAEAWNPEDETEEAFSRIVQCVNACTGMPDPAAQIQAMREVIREAYDTFVNLQEYWNQDQNESAMTDACWHTINESSAALAKLQPFLT